MCLFQPNPFWMLWTVFLRNIHLLLSRWRRFKGEWMLFHDTRLWTSDSLVGLLRDTSSENRWCFVEQTRRNVVTSSLIRQKVSPTRTETDHPVRSSIFQPSIQDSRILNCSFTLSFLSIQLLSWIPDFKPCEFFNSGSSFQTFITNDFTDQFFDRRHEQKMCRCLDRNPFSLKSDFHNKFHLRQSIHSFDTF